MTDAPRSQRSASWLSLLAATSLGLGALGCVDAEIAFDEPLDDGEGELRLVVQSYPAGSVRDGAPGVGRRPLGSTQRAVTREELRRGVPIRLVQLDAAQDREDIVAWVERGAANLDFDARAARPSSGAAVGWASNEGSTVRLVLRRG